MVIMANVKVIIEGYAKQLENGWVAHFQRA